MSGIRVLGLLATGALVLGLVISLVVGLDRGETPAPENTGEPDSRVTERVRVEVLNAAGISGLARLATDQLRDTGFDVVYYGNATRFGRDTSVVLDRVGSPEKAEAVAEAIEIEYVRSAPDSTLFLDVTVVLGRDWAGAPEAAADSSR